MSESFDIEPMKIHCPKCRQPRKFSEMFTDRNDPDDMSKWICQFCLNEERTQIDALAA